jgi:hypothetical protein
MEESQAFRVSSKLTSEAPALHCKSSRQQARKQQLHACTTRTAHRSGDRSPPYVIHFTNTVIIIPTSS